MNRYRTNGIFEITKKSFDIIGEILILILDKVVDDKDYESARYVIILSQTYHFVTEEGTKVSLQEKIESHPVLKNIFFWENFIAYSIYKEIEKQNKLDFSESEEEKNSRIANIVFSQLLPITDNMLSFEVNREEIKGSILSFSKQYNICDDLNGHLIQMVDEKVYLPKINKICLNEESKEEIKNNENLELNNHTESITIYESESHDNIHFIDEKD